jgi:hypothetical protein
MLNLRNPALELIPHLEEDRILLGEQSKISKFIMTTIEGADQTQGNFLIPGRRISHRWIGAPVAGRVVAQEDIGQDRIAQISGADSEGEIGGNHFYLFRAGEWVYALLMIKNDALKNLKGHSERAPGVVLQEGY